MSRGNWDRGLDLFSACPAFIPSSFLGGDSGASRVGGRKNEANGVGWVSVRARARATGRNLWKEQGGRKEVRIAFVHPLRFCRSVGRVRRLQLACTRREHCLLDEPYHARAMMMSFPKLGVALQRFSTSEVTLPLLPRPHHPWHPPLLPDPNRQEIIINLTEARGVALLELRTNENDIKYSFGIAFSYI